MRAQLADAGLVELCVVALLFLRLALLDGGLHQPATLIHVRRVDFSGDLEQARAVLDRQLPQQRAVRRGPLQDVRGRLELGQFVAAVAVVMGS